MLKQIKIFEGNALALEIDVSFTETDAELVKQLFEQKLRDGYEHVNILIKVKDFSIMRHMDFIGFWKGEIWGMKHFGKIGRCAVVAHSDAMKAIVEIEGKVLHLFNNALDERFFDTSELDEALRFISPNVE